MTADQRDAYAGELAGVVLRMAADLRDLDPEAVMRHTDGMDPTQLRHALIIACAHIPVELEPSVLTAWRTHPDQRPLRLAAWAAREQMRMEAAE